MGRSKLNLTVRSLFVSYLLATLLLAALASRAPAAQAK